MRYVTDYQLRDICKARKNYFNQHFEVPTMCVKRMVPIYCPTTMHILIATKLKIRKMICFTSELCQDMRSTSAH